MQKINNKFKSKIKSNFSLDGENMSNITIQDINSVTNDNLKIQEYLLSFLIKQLTNTSDPISQIEYSIFNKLENLKNMQDKVYKIFPNGMTEFRVYINKEYKELKIMLQEQRFQEADQITKIYLLKLAQQNNNIKREWLYFTEINSIPPYDLFLIDLLWKIYSKNKFGFSIQRNIWLSCNKNWNLFLKKIEWNQENKMRRYPNEFTWNINATKGHLPLFNQIRGNQAFLSLLQHKAWITYDY